MVRMSAAAKKVPTRVAICWKGELFQVPRVGSCLTLGNKLSKETHKLTKQVTLLGRGAHGESNRVGEPRRTALPHGFQSQVLCDGISFRVLPGGTCIAHPRWMSRRRILGGGRTDGISF